MVIFLYNNKAKGTDSIIPNKKDLPLNGPYQQGFWAILCLWKRGLSMSWIVVSRKIGRWRKKENIHLEHFSPSRCIFWWYLHKTFVMLNCQDQNRQVHLVREILSGAKCFLRCWSTLQWYKQSPGRGEVPSLLPAHRGLGNKATSHLHFFEPK